MIVSPVLTRLFIENEDLLSFITEHVKTLEENSVLVVTSKIIALSEGRTADPSEKLALIKAESSHALPTKYVWLTIKDNLLMATAGIDESNANGKLVLLPKDSYASAWMLWEALREHYNVDNLGILVTDSHTSPLRAGVIGVALGYAGFRGIRDYRGTKDLFDRTLVFSQTNVADNLASAAILEMGEGNESFPLAVITEASMQFSPEKRPDELLIDLEDDMYDALLRPLLDSHSDSLLS